MVAATHGTPDMTHFGLWLKNERARRGLAQPDVAEKAGTSVPTVSRLETGDRNPSKGLAVKIANALGADPKDALNALMKDSPGLDTATLEAKAGHGPLSPEELTILRLMSQLPPAEREAFIALMQTMADGKAQGKGDDTG